MICEHCKDAADNKRPSQHDNCTGKSQCNCQHKVGSILLFVDSMRKKRFLETPPIDEGGTL